MSRRRKVVLLVTALAVIVLGAVLFVLPYFAFVGLNVGSFDYSGEQITPEVIKRHCPAYETIYGARILHVRNDEGMTGGQMTIKFELPAHQLAAFLADSPFKGSALDSKSVPSGFLDPSWLPSRRYNELESSKAFSAASLSTGRTYHTILIDRTRSDVYVIYLQSTS